MPARDPRQARLSKQVLTSLEVLGWKRSDQGPASTLASVIDALRESQASSQRGASDAVKSTQLPHDHAHDQHDGQANVNYPQLHQHVASVPSEDGADLANALLERVLPRGYLSGVPTEGLEPNQGDVEQMLKQWKLCYRAATSGATGEADAQGRLADLCSTLWHAVRKMTFLTRSRTEAEAAYPGVDVTALLVFLRPWEKMVPMTDSALQASSWVMVVLYELMTHIWNLRVKVQQHVGALAVQPSPGRDMAAEQQHAAEGNAAEAEYCSEGLGQRWQDLQRWCQKLLTSMICWLLCQAEALPARGPDGLALLLQLGGAVLIMLLQSVVDGVLDFQDEGTTDVSKLVSRLTSSLMEVTIRTRSGETSSRLAASKAPRRNAAADGEGGASYPTVVSPGAAEAARAAEAPQKLIRNLNADVLQKLRVSSSSAASASGRRRPAAASSSPISAAPPAPASPAAAATAAPATAVAAAGLGGEWQLVEAAGPSRAAPQPQGWGSTVPAGLGHGARRRPKGVGAIIRRYLRSRRFTAGEFPHWRRREAVPAVVVAPARAGLPPGFVPAGTYSPAAGVVHLAPAASMPTQMIAAPPGYWLQGRGSLPVHYGQHTAQVPAGAAPGSAHAYSMQAADAQLADRPPGEGPGPAKGFRRRMAAWSKSAQVMWERVSTAGARLTEEMQAQFTSPSGQPQPDIGAAIPPIHEHPRLVAHAEPPPRPSVALAASLPPHIAAPPAVPVPAAAAAAAAAAETAPAAPPSAPPLPAYLADAAGPVEAQAAAVGAPSLYPVAVPAMGMPVASGAWHRAQSVPAEASRSRASSSGLYPTVGAASAAEPFGAQAPSEEPPPEIGLWPAVGRPSASSHPEPLPAAAAAAAATPPAGSTAAASPGTAAYPVVGAGLYPSLASTHSAAPRKQLHPHHYQPQHQPQPPDPTAAPPAAAAPLYPARVDAPPPLLPGPPVGGPDSELLPSAPLLGSTQSCPVPSPQPSGEASPDPFLVIRPSNSCDSAQPQPSAPPRLDSDSGADDSEASMMASAEEMRAGGVSELEERLVNMMGRELTSEIYHLETSMDQDALLLEYLLGRCEVVSHREVRLVGELGCGSFATVFRGEWSVPGVGRLEVAVKLLHEDIHNMDATVDSQEFKEFMREVECLRVLNHECVVKLLGVMLPEDEAWGGSSLASEPSTDPEEASWSSGQLEYGPSSGMPLDRLCIVMEYCLLGSLMDLIHQAKEVKGAFDRLMKDSGAPVCTKTLHSRMLADLERYIQQPGARLYFEWPLRLKLLGQAALGLAHMHDNHFLHRDLTSYNILVHSEVPEEEPVTLPQWTAKVADFNLCCYSSDGRQTYNSLGPHSPGWTAPELNQQGQITTASDVFSLGVVLWELLTLNRPPGGGTECYKVIFAAMHNNTQVLDFPIESELSPQPPLGWSHDVIVSLAQQCMHQEMAMRPTARQVSTTIDSLVQRLQS